MSEHDAAGQRPPVLAITGPTACGKSGLAIAVAEEFAGTIINADSMQIYRELPVLTARPTQADEARVPHRLYGVLSAAEACSAERWRAMATAEIDAALAARRLPILVGGTGFYLRALLRGMAPVPAIPPDVRESVRRRQASLAASALHAELAAKDARMAARLRLGDSQRIARALEVVEATGRSLADYQSQADTGAGAYDVLVIASLPPRRPLYEKIDRRLAEMVATGALDEVRRLMDMHLDPSLPAMKAVGVPDLMAHLRGETSLDEALAAAQQATRHYAKRQMTWLRHQTPKDADKAVFYRAQLSERLTPIIFNEIRQFMLTAQP